jgi:hypothetical protein
MMNGFYMYRSNAWGSPLTASLGNTAAQITGRDTTGFVLRALGGEPESFPLAELAGEAAVPVTYAGEPATLAAAAIPGLSGIADLVEYVLHFSMWGAVGLILLIFGLWILLK